MVRKVLSAILPISGVINLYIYAARLVYDVIRTMLLPSITIELIVALLELMKYSLLTHKLILQVICAMSTKFTRMILGILFV